MSSRRPLGKVRRALIVASAFSAGIGVLLLSLPVLALHLMDSIVPAGALGQMGMLAGAMAACLLVLATFQFCRELTLLRTGLWLDHNFGAAVIESGLASRATGEAVRTRIEALGSVRALLTSGGLASLLDLPWALAACGLVYLLHPLLALACAVALGAMTLCLVVSAASGAGALNNGEEADRWLEAATRDADQIAAQGLAGAVARGWERANRHLVFKRYRQGFRHGFAAATARTLAVAGLAGVMACAAYLAINGNLPPEAIVVTLLLLARALSILEQTIAGWPAVRAARAGWRQLRQLEREASTVARSGGKAAASAGHIVLANVACRYPTSERQALDGISLDVAPGECIGIIGPQGSGKSALAATIAGAMVPCSGRADIDGKSIAVRQRAMTPRAIGYMSDTPCLLPGTVLGNIAGFTDGAETSVAQAAARAGVHELLAALPRGYDAPIGEGGAGLSMRQRRAVALARAMHGDPAVVVLDEPELGLDELGLARLVAVLERLRHERVGLVLATAEPRLLHLSDRIVLMSAGRIEAVLPSHQVTGVHRLPGLPFERQVA